ASGLLGGMGGEFFVNFLRRQKQTLTDGSAVLTGILLVGTLSPGLPLWMPAAGSFVAIVFGKMLFGGLGYNIFNPALIGRAFLMATFPLAMTATWLKPFDAVTMATPLNLLKLEGVQNAVYRDLFFGVRSGSIGELSVFLVLLGAAILLWKKIIRLTIPLSVIAGFLLVALFSKYPLFQLMTGGLWFGAFFMATDYVTAPMTPKGEIIFGLGVGILTAVIRLKGGYPEGICYAILIMNAVTPALNRWFKPKRPSWEGGVP
ncbi:MAG: RnfABCDGE type electron transport complex subunit D, partial [Deltaproteobacteria bacterium]|nr:RnfABCDGE type electron transport complex subunit D [Deltaproteobacteria bacterium]